MPGHLCPYVAIIGHMRAEVRIAELKSNLSRYLRSVQAGNEIVIKDRETPIARLVPCQRPKRRLLSRQPVGPLKDLDQAPVYSPKKLTLRDLERALRQERRDRL